MKCIEEPNVMTFYSNMEITHYEVWWCNTASKASLDDGKLKSELKRNPAFRSFSPYNFFRENLVFEVNRDMTLSQVAKDILGQAQVFVEYPSEEVKDSELKIGDISTGDKIVDLVFVKKEPLEEEKKEETKSEDESKITPQFSFPVPVFPTSSSPFFQTMPQPALLPPNFPLPNIDWANIPSPTINAGILQSIPTAPKKPTIIKPPEPI